MSKVWVVALAMSLTCGCQSGEEPARGSDRPPPAITYVPAASEPEERVETPSLDLRNDPQLVLERYGKGDEEAPERNLSEELGVALGVPTDCVRDFKSSRPTTIRVSVSGIVRPTGMVIQPTAYGSGLSNQARQCIERRVAALSLKPLDDTVSQAVSTVIQIEYEPPVVVESEPGVPEPVLRNVREPLPKRPEVAPSGTAINRFPTERWISSGFDGGRPIQEPSSRRVRGPKPRAIDGYEVDENAQDWSNR